MTNIFIFHGVNENDQENWYPWLRQELESRGYQVFIPNFPTPEGQTLENWLANFSQYKSQLTEESIVIGHSLGTLFGLSIIESYTVKAFISTAGFGELPGNKFDSGMATFTKNFDWEKVKNNAKTFLVLHGDNDPYVRTETAEKLAKSLNTKAIFIHNGGHFDGVDGYTKFPFLLEKIIESAD